MTSLIQICNNGSVFRELMLHCQMNACGSALHQRICENGSWLLGRILIYANSYHALEYF